MYFVGFGIFPGNVQRVGNHLTMEDVIRFEDQLSFPYWSVYSILILKRLKERQSVAIWTF
jgi:hypothetical protein